MEHALDFDLHVLCPEMRMLPNYIENEYGAQSKLQGAAGQNYVNWAAKMAVEMGTGVPWVMCKEDNAPYLVVSPRSSGKHSHSSS
ncbi:Beta-galactosidase 5 [Glycine soja]|uniref:Beta-galactosidase 5 n=1 Tax=Glycine soja TaxID=3848 RepID=A0A0B2PAN4_GLYSO|nr:Beta-galactosidase 5 [Glycine soja]